MEYLLLDHQSDPSLWAFQKNEVTSLWRQARIHACSTELQKLGVRQGMTIRRARRLAPQMRLLSIPADLDGVSALQYYS
ncbi:hypothetical protein KDA23_07300 [Candidatus Saccharibacteria bacterium]|nr:hypothetical protein [Candidatus Saccharibacteria bacterium]